MTFILRKEYPFGYFFMITIGLILLSQSLLGVRLSPVFLWYLVGLFCLSFGAYQIYMAYKFNKGNNKVSLKETYIDFHHVGLQRIDHKKLYYNMIKEIRFSYEDDDEKLIISDENFKDYEFVSSSFSKSSDYADFKDLIELKIKN